LYATIPGQDYPRKPRIAEVFKDEDERIDDCIRGIKKRKIAKDQAGQIILSTTSQATSNYFDTSYWNIGLATILFVPLVGESVKDCLASRRIASLHHSNSLLEAA
jgi:hypothetical protein